MLIWFPDKLHEILSVAINTQNFQFEIMNLVSTFKEVESTRKMLGEFLNIFLN